VRYHPLPVVVSLSLVATLTLAGPAPATGAGAGNDLDGAVAEPATPPGLEDGGAAGDWLHRTDALIVQPAQGHSAGQIRARVARLTGEGAALGKTVGTGEARSIDLPEDAPVDDLRELADQLVSEGLAEYAEPDLRMAPFVINDPGYPLQWHLFGKGATGTTHGIDVEAAWKRTTGSPDVTVAVLDTGSVAHPDIDPQDLAGYDMITDPAIAQDGDGRDGDPTDVGDWASAGDCGKGSPARSSSWHGLHVAGTIGASTNNGIGVAGVDQRARIQHVRVLGRCGGAMSDLADGIRWAAGLPVTGVPVNTTPARVINLSLGGSGACATTLQSAVDAAITAGSVIIAAAGNANLDAANTSPANCDGAITVAATSPAGDRAGAMQKVDEAAVRVPYSNYGQVVDIAAPGGDNAFSGGGVLSTYNLGENKAGNHGYAGMLGTSMAAPHVAGVVSLILAVNDQLTPTQVRALLSGTARPFGSSSGVFRCSSSRSATYHCGAGIVDAGAAVSVASGEASAARLNASNGDLEVSLSWTPSTSLHGPMAYELRRATGASCTAGSAVIAGPASSRSHTDTALAHDITYRYCVTAVDSNGRRSSVSNTRSVKTTDLTAPAAPSLSATGGNEEVSLAWTAVSDPTTPITYRLYRSTSSSCSTSSTLIRTQTARSYTDTGLKAGTTYRHCLTATDGAGNRSSLSNITKATTSASVGASSPGAVCHALVGDWNGSGRAGIGWWCDGRTRLRTAQGSTFDFVYGRRGDVPVVADWNGNGHDTISVIRDGTWHVNNALGGGASERTFVYGRVSRGDVPITGRWDREARDLPGIIRDREWHLRNEQSGGSATWLFTYGRLTAGDLPLVGDWNADQRDSAGIVRQGEWHLRNSHTGGGADLSYVYGRVTSGDVPVVGDWTGDGMDTPGIVRAGTWYLKDRHGGGSADRTITFPAP
jgi:subtilisin family serine protease